MSAVDLFVLFTFGCVLLLVGFSKFSRTESAYLVADRKTGFIALTATLVMTEFNTATLLSFSSLGYVAGFWALLLPFIFLIGLFFYALVVAKKWKSFDGLSVAAYFSKRYGEDIGKVASVALLVAMAGFSATYVKSLVLLFTPIFPSLSEWKLSGLFTALALLMTLRGGLFSIIKTDIISAVATIFFIPFVAYSTFDTSSISLVETDSTIVPLWFIGSLTILTMFTYILAPWYGQKIFSARSERTAYFSVICAAIIIFCLYGCAIFATALLKTSGITLSNPELAFPYALSVLPNGLRGLGYGILFAASATTLTGVWSAMASMFIGDFLKYEPENASGRALLIVTLFATLSYFLSNLMVDRILAKLILANIPVAALSFALLGGFYWEKASKFGAYCSIITGLFWGVACYLYWGEEGGYTWYWAVFGIPLIFGAGIAGSYTSFLIPSRFSSNNC